METTNNAERKPRVVIHRQPDDDTLIEWMNDGSCEATEITRNHNIIITRTSALAKLTKMMLNAVDKRLSKTERALWQKQAWFLAKRIEGGRVI